MPALSATPLRICVAVALALIGVRLVALAWNTDVIFGDVNLFALVARQWQETGALAYPGKYDFSAQIPYLDLAAPVSQHPPGWSWLGGTLAGLLGTADTYRALQIAGLLPGLLIAAVGARLGWLLGGRKTALACALTLGLHPYLVDYSVNGSPYLWLGLATLTIPWCALEKRLPAVVAGGISGLAAGLAASFHGASLALMPFGLIALLVCRPSGRLFLGLGYVAALSLVMLPTVLWMTENFARPWFTTTTDYVYAQIGRLQRVQDADGIRSVRLALQPADWLRLCGLAVRSTLNYALHAACELGWVGALAAGAAALRLRRESPRLGVALALVALGAALPCLAWPSFKYRFLCALLPLLVLLATWAWASSASAWARRGAALAVLVVLAFWGAQWTITGSPAKYYAFDREHRADYALMREATASLAAAPEGLVLVFPDNLDGGVAAAWWYPHRSVFARGASDRTLLRLAADFAPVYALLNPDRAAFVETHFPAARLLHANSRYAVYRLRP